MIEALLEREIMFWLQSDLIWFPSLLAFRKDLEHQNYQINNAWKWQSFPIVLLTVIPRIFVKRVLTDSK